MAYRLTELGFVGSVVRYTVSGPSAFINHRPIPDPECPQLLQRNAWHARATGGGAAKR